MVVELASTFNWFTFSKTNVEAEVSSLIRERAIAGKTAVDNPRVLKGVQLKPSIIPLLIRWASGAGHWVKTHTY